MPVSNNCKRLSRQFSKNHSRIGRGLHFFYDYVSVSEMGTRLKLITRSRGNGIREWALSKPDRL